NSDLISWLRHVDVGVAPVCHPIGCAPYCFDWVDREVEENGHPSFSINFRPWQGLLMHVRPLRYLFAVCTLRSLNTATPGSLTSLEVPAFSSNPTDDKDWCGVVAWSTCHGPSLLLASQYSTLPVTS